MHHRSTRHRCGRFLVAHVICALATSWLLSTGVSAVAVTRGSIIVHATNVTVETSHSQSGRLVSTGAPSSSVLPSMLIYPPDTANKNGAERSSDVQGPDMDSFPSLQNWCRAHISAKFFKLRTLYSRASFMGRAATGTVFVATSLLVALSIFALSWCLCHSCKSEQKEVDPVAVVAPSSLPPSSRTPKDGPSNSYSSRVLDAPPPYDICLQASTKQTLPHEMAVSLQPAAPEDAERPPTYNEVVLSVPDQPGVEIKDK